MRTSTSTEPNGNSSHSKGLSLESQSSITTIKLLSMDIPVKQPIESGCMRDKDNNDCEEVEGVDQ